MSTKVDPIKDPLTMENFCPKYEDALTVELLKSAQDLKPGYSCAVGILYGTLVDKFTRNPELIKQLKKIGVGLTIMIIPGLPQLRYKTLDFQYWEYHDPHCLVLSKKK